MISRIRLTAVMAAAACLVSASEALAWKERWTCNPYAVVRHCDGDGGNCRLKTVYEDGHRLSSNPRSSHWYGMVVPEAVRKRVERHRSVTGDGHIITAARVCRRQLLRH